MTIFDKTAVVTGISSGIGLALTKKLLDSDYRVIGTTRTGDLKGFAHNNLNIVGMEATDNHSIGRAIRDISKLSGKIDLLINNAGAAPDVFDVIPALDTFNQTLLTNITGSVFFTEPLLESMHDGGQIIFISSNMALMKNADVNGPAYRMSKAAINMYAAMLSKRLVTRNIKVTPVHPGWVQTRLGGDKAPLTPAQSAEGIYNGILHNMESGRFYNIMIPGTEEY